MLAASATLPATSAAASASRQVRRPLRSLLSARPAVIAAARLRASPALRSHAYSSFASLQYNLEAASKSQHPSPADRLHGTVTTAVAVIRFVTAARRVLEAGRRDRGSMLVQYVHSMDAGCQMLKHDAHAQQLAHL